MELTKLKEGVAVLIDVPMLFNDNGDPESGFKVVGANSPEYQEADREWKLRGVLKSAHRGRGIDASTKNGAEELVDLIAKRELTMACACIKEIYGFTDDGKPAVLNGATIATIFKARPTWRSKVVAAIEAEQIFTTASSGG